MTVAEFEELLESSGGSGAAESAGSSSRVQSVGGPATGAMPYFSFEDFQLWDTTAARVNIGNGNLLVEVNDVQLDAPGIAHRVDRYYNSLADTSSTSPLRDRWSLSFGPDINLDVDGDEATFHGPTGIAQTFEQDSSGRWVAPPGMNADLLELGSGRFELTYQRSGERLVFSDRGRLLHNTDRNEVGTTAWAQVQIDPPTIVAHGMEDAAGRFSYVHLDVSTQRATHLRNASRDTLFAYDSNGRLSEVTSPSKPSDPDDVTEYEYGSNGLLAWITSPNGFHTRFSYDASDRVSEVHRYLTQGARTGAAAVTAFDYDGEETTVTDANGHESVFVFDSQDRAIEVSDPLGRSRSQTWTPNSDIATSTDAMGSGSTPGNTTVYDYDELNNVTSMTLPTGAALRATYGLDTDCPNANGSHAHVPTCVIDDAGNKLGFDYDAAGNVLKREDVTSGGTGAEQVSYTREDDTGTVCGAFAGQVCTSTDGEGNSTSYSYDADGNLAEVDPPGPLGTTEYVYDSIGRLVEVTDGKNTTRTLTYDISDRLVATTWDSDPSSLDAVVYDYDLDGNEISQTDHHDGATTELVRTYDALGRVTSEQDPDVAASAHDMTYDDAGNLLTMTTVAGTTTYDYDDADQLQTLTQPGGSCPSSGVPAVNSGCIQFDYDNNGAVTEQAYPGGATQATERDESGRPIRITGTTGNGQIFSDHSYNYTTDSNDDRILIQSRTQHAGPQLAAAQRQGCCPSTSVETSYTYDSLNRLTIADETTSGGGASTDRRWEFDYDDAGNTTRNFTGTTPYVYRFYTYEHNASNQATTLTLSSPGNPLTQIPVSYDDNGNETSRGSATSTWTDRDQLANRGGTSFTYHGELNDRLRSIGNASVTNSPFGISAITPPASGDEQRITRLPDGTPLAVTIGSTENYFITDPTGSVLALTSGTGEHSGTYDYGPYGDLLNDNTLTTAAAANPIRYTSGLFINTTGQYKFGSRYYDTTMARFTHMDPTGQETNPYTYAQSDPINNTDPTGRESVECIASAAGLGLNLGSDAWSLYTLGAGLALGSGVGIALGIGGLAAGVAVSTALSSYVGDYC